MAQKFWPETPRGLITSARIAAQRDLGGFGWITALRAPAVAALAADDGPLQLSLFDQQDCCSTPGPASPVDDQPAVGGARRTGVWLAGGLAGWRRQVR